MDQAQLCPAGCSLVGLKLVQTVRMMIYCTQVILGHS